MATGVAKTESTQSSKYFSKEKRFLKIFGLSFTGDESVAYRIYSFVLILSTSFAYPVLEFRELFVHDIEVVSDMLIYVFGTYVALAKTIVAVQNRITIGKILDKLEREPFTVNLERGGLEEKKLVETCVFITHFQTLIYWILSFGTIYFQATYIAIKGWKSNSNNWDLPYGPLTITNLTYSPNYEIAFAYQIVCLTSIVSHFTTIDLLMAAVLAHISFQFKILQNNLRRIVRNSYGNMQKDKQGVTHLSDAENKPFNWNIDGSTIPWKYLHKHLKRAIQYHLEIAAVAKDMEHVFSKLLLTIFLGTLGIMCFSVYRTSVVEDRVKMMIHVGDAFSGIVQVLTVCYWGEQVLFESQQVGRAAYEANFVGTDARFQKGLVLVIRRTQNPIKLTAGGFADICLVTFTWIMRTSYSAFMIVRGNNKSTN